MSKKNGILFSKSLFGYRRKDVIEYIRNVDTAHADELARVTAEKDGLQDKLNNAEIKISETVNLLNAERINSQEKIKKITAECDKKLSELTIAINAQRDKLADSENRASSYLKLVDSSSLRAENAEAELTILSAAIEDYKAEIADLKEKLSEKEAEIKRAAEFDALAKKLLENHSAKKHSDLPSIFTLFKKSRHHK